MQSTSLVQLPIYHSLIPLCLGKNSEDLVCEEWAVRLNIRSSVRFRRLQTIEDRYELGLDEVDEDEVNWCVVSHGRRLGRHKSGYGVEGKRCMQRIVSHSRARLQKPLLSTRELGTID